VRIRRSEIRVDLRRAVQETINPADQSTAASRVEGEQGCSPDSRGAERSMQAQRGISATRA
jgi:hypothetical protein